MVYHTTMNLMWCDIDVTANKCQVKFWHNVCVCTIWVYLHWHLFTYGRFWKIGRSMQTSNILIDLIGLPVQQNDQYHMENRHSKWVNRQTKWACARCCQSDGLMYWTVCRWSSRISRLSEKWRFQLPKNQRYTRWIQEFNSMSNEGWQCHAMSTISTAKWWIYNDSTWFKWPKPWFKHQTWGFEYTRSGAHYGKYMIRNGKIMFSKGYGILGLNCQKDIDQPHRAASRQCISLDPFFQALQLLPRSCGMNRVAI